MCFSFSKIAKREGFVYNSYLISKNLKNIN